MNQQLVKQLCDFVDASPTAYHAVGNIAAALEAAGAVRLAEGEAWKLEPGCAYFVARSDSGLIAFRTGLRPPAEEGFALAGGHTDSPALKLRLEKPLSGRGMDRAAVEVYGGPIVSTWLDRPLSLAGRAVIRTRNAAASGGAPLETRLVNFARPVGLIPNLAIHLNREVNKGFEYNAQNHLPVLLSASGEAAAAGSAAGTAMGSPAARLVAAELGVEPEDILGADLFFVDAQKVAVIGPQSELVNGYRLDDLTACHAILAAFLASSPAAHGQVACFLDHEEVGSRSIQGADSSFIRDTLGRIASLQGTSTEGFYRALASSFSVSVDVAQAFHSSYAEKYDESFAPVLNGGPAVKVNANQRYATDAEAEGRFRLLCAEAGYPCQKFMSRADMAPGSTIGPLSASITGIKTVDVGAPLLSMHSIRETVGARDHEAMTAVIGRHFAASPRMQR
jgi:aspartyl aminopeptidase